MRRVWVCQFVIVLVAGQDFVKHIGVSEITARDFVSNALNIKSAIVNAWEEALTYPALAKSFLTISEKFPSWQQFEKFTGSNKGWDTKQTIFQIQWVSAVKNVDRSKFEASQQSNKPGFSIFSVGPNGSGVRPVNWSNVYFPITYCSPPNPFILGLDLNDEVEGPTILRAKSSGLTATSGPFNGRALPPRETFTKLFGIYMPLYFVNESLTDIMTEDFAGSLVTIVAFRPMITNVLQGFSMNNVDIFLFWINELGQQSSYVGHFESAPRSTMPNYTWEIASRLRPSDITGDIVTTFTSTLDIDFFDKKFRLMVRARLGTTPKEISVFGSSPIPGNRTMCTKMSVCAEIQQQEVAVIRVEDTSGKIVTFRVTDRGQLNRAGDRSVPYDFCDPRGASGCNMSVALRSQGIWIVSIFADGQEIDQSPVLVEVLPRLCQGGRAGNELGDCVCPAGTADLDGRCVEIAILLLALLLPLTALAVVAAAAGFRFGAWSAEAPGERMVRLKILELRKQLALTRKDGFVLDSEWLPLPAMVTSRLFSTWNPRRRRHSIVGRVSPNAPTVLPWAALDAAARLALGRDDVDSRWLDALCFAVHEHSCVDCEEGTEAADTSRPANGGPCACLREWLLEICGMLLDPCDGPSRRPTVVSLAYMVRGRVAPAPSFAAASHPRGQAARFSYFQEKFACLRAWELHEGQLFEDLQRRAGLFMTEVGGWCTARFEEMVREPEGQNLAALKEMSVQPAAKKGKDEASCSTPSVRDEGESGLQDSSRQLVESFERAASLASTTRKGKESCSKEVSSIRIWGARDDLIRQDDPEVRAIRIHKEDQMEAILQLGSSIECTTGEEVFVAQLARRAALLNSAFQRRVVDVIARHASNIQNSGATIDSPDLQKCENKKSDSNLVKKESACSISKEPGRHLSDSLGRTSSTELRSQSIGVLNQWRGSLPCKGMVRGPASGATDSSGGISKVECWFSYSADEIVDLTSCLGEGDVSNDEQGRWKGCVEVHLAQPKGYSRMLEKLREYEPPHPRAVWPLCANILDPVRCSIICPGASAMLQVLNWFVNEEDKNGFTVCRVKNKFALPREEVPDGYRDVQLSVMVEAEEGLRIIGEIQVHDFELHRLKGKMHCLYKVTRATSAKSLLS